MKIERGSSLSATEYKATKEELANTVRARDYDKDVGFGEVEDPTDLHWIQGFGKPEEGSGIDGFFITLQNKKDKKLYRVTLTAEEVRYIHNQALAEDPLFFTERRNVEMATKDAKSDTEFLDELKKL